MAETVFKTADPELQDVRFGDLVRVYGPEVGLAAYIEEVTKTPTEIPEYIGRQDFLNAYLDKLAGSERQKYARGMAIS